MRLSIRHQIVGPFVVLVVFVGIVGTAVVMTHFAGSTQAQFDGSLLRAGMLANDHLALLEADRLLLLRSAADTQGVADALKTGNRAALRRLLLPVLANVASPDLTLQVLNRQGTEVLALQGSNATEIPSTSVPAADYSRTPEVRAALAGRADSAGDKYAFVTPDSQQPAVHWVGPVRNDDQSVAGVVLLSQPLAGIGAGIQGTRASDVLFFDPSGHALYSSLPGQASLAPAVTKLVTADHPTRVVENVNNHPYGLLVSDWRLRDRPVGYMGVALDAADWQSSLAQLRLFLVLLFAAASLFALFVGMALARRITQPIDELVGAMRRVAAGDLHHRAPAGPANEIGYLASTFNEMTASLEQKTQQLERAYLGSLEALARALDARDPFTFQRSARIAAICHELALAMDLSPDERQALHRSALLHDIGEIGLDDRILLKSGPLTETELAVIRRHPTMGYEMLKDLPFLAPSLAGVRHHHERWDGFGYPDGLKGNAIPLPVRILSVADAFDAMTSDRAHRKSFSFDFAARALRSSAGTQFDPSVVEAFERRVSTIIARMREMRDQPTPHAADIRSLEEAV
jgi:response regulator RpfG family c-di-GMP phosphodiesterase